MLNVLLHLFKQDNMLKDFGLAELYNKCKKNPIKKRKGKQDLDAKPEENGQEKTKTE